MPPEPDTIETSARRGSLGAVLAVGMLAVAMLVVPLGARQSDPAADLDAFMQRVLARRDENWRKLQQYVLDERETVQVLAPGNARLFGRQREFTWFERDGVFIRSPLRVDGVHLGDADRLDYERRWLKRERGRRERRDRRAASDADADALIRQVEEPAFVSAAYFLRFPFEPDRYALVGREEVGGSRVLRIEYYPKRLFHDSEAEGDADGIDQRIDRSLNKVALVTLWIEPTAHQIVQYTFDNLGFDFLPGRSFARVDSARASMRMDQPFPGVWLPRHVLARAAVTLAQGTFEAMFDVEYHDYREASVAVRVR